MLQKAEVNESRLQVPGLPADSKAGQMTPRLLSGTQAGMYLGVSATTVRRLFYDGQIPALRFGKKLRYDVRDLDAWISREKDKP